LKCCYVKNAAKNYQGRPEKRITENNQKRIIEDNSKSDYNSKQIIKEKSKNVS
jgi:hypothetical protein